MQQAWSNVWMLEYWVRGRHVALILASQVY